MKYQIEKLQLRLGDTVFVEKGGEIIPKIISVLKDKREIESVKFNFTKNCPSCGSPLVIEDNQAVSYCQNHKYCKPQIYGRIEHFISKNAKDIEHIGPETIKGLVDRNIINNVSDLYKIKFEDIIDLEFQLNEEGKIRSLKEKSCNNIIKSIKISKSKPFSNLLFALGIRYVGKTTAEKLASHYKSIDNLINADFDDIISVDEVGDKIAESICEFFKDNDNISIVSKLEKNGLKLYSKKKINIDSSIKNIKFVITGTFINYTRDELKNIIKINGGKISSSISKNTDFLILGKNFGPSKKSKADNLGIKMISENDFENLLLT